LLFFGLF